MRDELMGLLDDLAGSEGVTDEWEAFRDYGFDEWFNLIDDILPNGAREAQGVVLEPDDVEVVSTFLARRDAVWARLGPHGTYDAYSADAEWPAVVEASRQALSAMRRT